MVGVGTVSPGPRSGKTTAAAVTQALEWDAFVPIEKLKHSCRWPMIFYTTNGVSL